MKIYSEKYVASLDHVIMCARSDYVGASRCTLQFSLLHTFIDAKTNIKIYYCGFMEVFCGRFIGLFSFSGTDTLEWKDKSQFKLWINCKILEEKIDEIRTYTIA